MKAIRIHQFGEPDTMQVESLPDLHPAPGQVLVQIKAAGVNPVDTYIRSGIYARKPALPYTPGIDGAGIVTAVGEGVTHIAVGDRVYGGWPITGTYAEQALYTADQVYPLPSQISFSQGAALFIPYSTAYRGLFTRGQGLPGETVLIHGATGGVGLAAVQWAAAAGMTVIGTGSSSEGRQLVASQGAHHTLDHNAAEAEDQIRTLTQGKGVDLILEMAAHLNLSRDLRLLAPQGRVVLIGSRGPVEINPRELLLPETQILGLSLFSTPTAEMEQVQAALQAGLRHGTLQPIVRRELLLEEAAEAHRLVLAPAAYGKIVLLPAALK